MTLPLLVVTTSVNPPPELEARARTLAVQLCAPYAPRRNATAARVFADTGAARMLVVGVDRLLLRDRTTGSEYFFHPNMAPVRGLNIGRGQRDLFAEATGLAPGDHLLDCTLGFAAEATLGALLVGELGTVVGLESAPELAETTRQGLQTFPMQTRVLAEAMRRIQVVTADYRAYLPRCVSDAFDVVYFDPFFDHRLRGSENSVSPLFVFGNPAPLDTASVLEARRVARRRVVIKHPKFEPLPEELEAAVIETITSKRSRVVYRVLGT